MANLIRRQPCTACPYRRDVPSGVWSEEDYSKLPRYDAPTGEQPYESFSCHATPEFMCHGWAVVHTSRGHEYDLMALRLLGLFTRGPIAIPRPKVPLFASGAEAAAHGIRDIKHPSRRAKQVMRALMARYARISDQTQPR